MLNSGTHFMEEEFAHYGATFLLILARVAESDHLNFPDVFELVNNQTRAYHNALDEVASHDRRRYGPTFPVVLGESRLVQSLNNQH